MVKQKIFLAFLILILSCFQPRLPANAAQTESDAPFLYYYSYPHHAFVIERADGTDHRLIGAGLMPDSYNEVEDMAWSSSGKWFAWMFVQTRFSQQKPSPDAAYVVSRDGSKHISLLDDFNLQTTIGVLSVVSVKWSPIADMLSLVLEVDWIGGEAKSEIRMYLIDIEAKTIIAQYIIKTPYQGLATSLNWSPDGRYAMMNYGSDNGGRLLKIFTDRAVTEQIISGIQCQGLEDGSGIWIPGPTAQIYVDISRTRLIIEPFIEGKPFSVALPVGCIRYVDWRADGKFAFLYIDGEHFASDLWLLSMVNRTLQRITTQRPEELFQYWLTDPWSPNGKYALFITGNVDFHVLDLSTLSSQVIQANVEAGLYYGFYYGVLEEWSSDGNRLYFGSPENVIYIYDSSSQKSIPIQVKYQLGGSFSVSPNERYFAYICDRNQEILLGCITDRVTDTTIKVKLHREAKVPRGDKPGYHTLNR